jgi:hypothetical protein
MVADIEIIPVGALQLERCCCDIKNGQQEIKCLIENTAKDQEIARLNRVVDAQRDQNIINQVVAALKGTHRLSNF